jgi:hypothetical protein
MTRRTNWIGLTNASVLLLLAGAAVSIAPRRAEAQWMNSDIGITAGYNRATVSGQDVQSASSINGFILGVSLVHRVNSMWSVQPELLYSRRGAKSSKVTGDFSDYNLEGTTDYIDLPVLAKIGFSEMGTSGVRPAVYIGPYIGMNLSCTIKGTQFGQKVDESCDKLPVNPFTIKSKSLDYGGIAGAGIDWSKFGVFARYQMGLAKISEKYDPKHRVITVGGRLSLGRIG